MDACTSWTDSSKSSSDLKDKSEGWMEFVAEDLESDKTLWALYKRWCKAFNQERDHDEMLRRFNEFKANVLFVHHSNNNPNLSYKLGITKFADGKLRESCLTGNRRDYLLAKQLAFSSALYKAGSDKILRRVYADFEVVVADCMLIYLRGFS